jgi:hypothetical protein
MQAEHQDRNGGAACRSDFKREEAHDQRRLVGTRCPGAHPACGPAAQRVWALRKRNRASGAVAAAIIAFGLSVKYVSPYIYVPCSWIWWPFC